MDAPEPKKPSKLWIGSETLYDMLDPKDDDTLYLLLGDDGNPVPEPEPEMETEI